jgi:hypothetical protein
MPIASSNTGNFSPVPEGVQHAICYSVIDIGTQPSFGNFPARRKVKIVWELPNEKIEVKSKDGHGTVQMPRAISKDYTLSTDRKANLRHDLESWRGKPFTADEIKAFDVGTIIGANCQLSVVHKPSADGTKIYANIAAIMPLAKGMVKLSPENKTLVYDIPSDGPIAFPVDMPEWIQNQIKNSEEFVDRANGHKKGPTDAQMANLDPAANPDNTPF